jgi:hypothetical protein
LGWPIPHGRVHENKVGRYCHWRTCSRGRSGECTTPDDRPNTCAASAPPVSQQVPRSSTDVYQSYHTRKGIASASLRPLVGDLCLVFLSL